MRRALVVLFSFSTIACASANLVKRDVLAVAKGPSLKHAAVAVVATGTALLIDDEIAARAPRHESAFFDNVETLGGGGSDKVMAAFLLYGLASRDARARDAGVDALISSVIASRVITPALKQVTNRTRPNGGDESFPSNHATQSFALASAISAHYPRVRWLAYALAGSVGAARLVHNAHWTSDVVAGAAIGTFVGHTVAKRNIDERSRWRVTVLGVRLR